MLPLVAATLMASTIESAGYSFGPVPSRENGNYLANRAPLTATPFLELPAGVVKPRGWVAEVLNRQRHGLNGNLGEISAWLQKSDNAWLSPESKGAWGWEEVPYWLKGYAEMGYILGDKAVIAEAQTWIEAVLASQKPDGNFGPVTTDENGVEDFWPKMIMLYVLQSYYAHSHDKRVIDLMEEFFRYQLAYPEDRFLKMYWQSRRTGDNLHSVLWLYNLTGEEWLLDLARKIHRCGIDWTPRDTPPDQYMESMPDWHNVNIAQGFREPAIYSQVSGKESDKAASTDAFRTVRRYFGQVPGGMFGADEDARPGYSDPRQAVETCGMVEQVNSDLEMLRITGDRFWGDHVEDVVFNTLPAAYMPDMKSLRYLTAPNMVLSDDQNHSPGIQNRGPFLMMNPFSSRCCQHNHGMGWPYLIKNLLMASADRGVLAAVYAPFEAKVKVGNGQMVAIALETHYPFEETLRFAVDPDVPTAFPFYFRIPAWCRSPEVKINGREVPLPGVVGPFLKIDRTWSRGDQVEVKFPMAVSLRTWTANKGSVSVDYGPLTFSLRIEEIYERADSISGAIGDSKWQPGADPEKWPSFLIKPGSAWNFGLLPGRQFDIERKLWPKDDYPWTLQAAPLAIHARGKKIPGWTLDEHGLCGTLPPSPIHADGAEQPIELVPMGAARLRISAFPVVE
ncbi:MAG: glycoside hydrolase family 127 protein [Fimbriimonadaceae bacterium]|nr:glycoside hydrolase family 127 protein [Fimbriimonadaceae bacterium]